jgi:hypothetical protein
MMEQRTLLVRCKKEIPMFLVKLIDPINYVRETLSPLKMSVHPERIAPSRRYRGMLFALL